MNDLIAGLIFAVVLIGTFEMLCCFFKVEKRNE